MSEYIGEHSKDDSEIVEAHLPCEDCGSSNALSLYPDHTYCFSCSEHTWTNKRTQQGMDSDTPVGITKGIYGTLKDRRITKDVCKKYGVTVRAVKDGDGGHDIIKHYYPYYDKDNKLIAQKVRYVADKEAMPWEGRPKKATLFGQNVVQKGGKKNSILTITEGELDAMAAYQMFGMRYNFVSIPNGARGAVRDCKKNLEFLDKFNEIYICFDNDEEGRRAAKEVAMLFDGRAKIVELDEGFKDACDYLVRGKEKEFTEAWWGSEFYVPAEIFTGDSILELIDDYEEQECFSVPWVGLDKMTYGYRLGETWAVVSHAKVGKTSSIREIVHHIVHDSERDHKVGTIFLEGPVREHALGFLSLEADIPFHLPDSVYTAKDYEDAKLSLPVNRLCFYKREGVVDIDSILGVIRYYIRAMDCKVVILDNLMSLVSSQPTDEERQLLNKTITRVVKLAEDTNTFIIIVAHLNRQTGLIHGTSLLEKQAYTVLELDRDLKAETHRERNTTQVYVNYNRFSGDTGLACDLLYEKSTGRMVELDVSEKSEELVTKKKSKKKSKGYSKTKKIKNEFQNEEVTEYVEPDVD